MDSIEAGMLRMTTVFENAKMMDLWNDFMLLFLYASQIPFPSSERAGCQNMTS